ncbi:hypothetical protein HOU00_gp162 [Caulobacter phage CcrPW]|uniref:Uncharacterized protein n=1 Tax=Caulobacter phage CcrPW TaxID=2283271 RepID=A0A385EAZ7_9CAUD|nr:hypothetical protein HOU00_gp162 [Caulobacter phage CcrPW]AXQ68963.1 hypothetical protein CcrPW_gp424c [Caulobacter phage CcrPW]
MSVQQCDAWRWRRRITAGKPNPWVYRDGGDSPAHFLRQPGSFEVEFLRVEPATKPTHYDIRVDTYSDEITRLPAHRVTPVVLP